MKVIYSIGLGLGGGGIGNVAYYASREIYASNKLQKVICQGNKQNTIPQDKIIDLIWTKYFIRYPLRFLEKFIFKNFKSYYYIDCLYDYLVSKKIEKCDIFHYWRNQGLHSARKAKKLGAKIFVENASSHPLTQKKLLEEEYKIYGLKNFKAFSDKQLKRALDELNQADYIVVTKGFAYQSFLDQGFPRKKLVPVSFGIDFDKFREFRRKKKDEKFRVLFVGQVTLRKGIQYLLQAWREMNLRNAELVVVGNVCPDMEKVVEKYLENPSIKFMGFDSNLKEHYQNSDIFVFPTIEEGSALVNYEAMAYGLPLITTYNSGTIARNGKEGFIVPIRNVKTLKEKILWLRKNPKKRLLMGKQARRIVEKYPWKNYGQEIVKAYERTQKNEEKLSLKRPQ